MFILILLLLACVYAWIDGKEPLEHCNNLIVTPILIVLINIIRQHVYILEIKYLMKNYLKYFKFIHQILFQLL